MIQFYEYATDKPVTTPEDFPLGWCLLKQLTVTGGRRQDIWARRGRKIFSIVPAEQRIYTVTAFNPTGEEIHYCFYDATAAHRYYVDWVDKYPDIDYEEGTL